MSALWPGACGSGGHPQTYGRPRIAVPPTLATRYPLEQGASREPLCSIACCTAGAQSSARLAARPRGGRIPADLAAPFKGKCAQRSCAHATTRPTSVSAPFGSTRAEQVHTRCHASLPGERVRARWHSQPTADPGWLRGQGRLRGTASRVPASSSQRCAIACRAAGWSDPACDRQRARASRWQRARARSTATRAGALRRRAAPSPAAAARRPRLPPARLRAT